MFKKILIVGCFSFTTLSASAAVRYCADPADLHAKAQDCSDNELFSGAAVECLEGIEKAIEMQKAAVSANLASKGAASKANQAGKQNNAMLDYALSKDVLNLLIAQAKAAQLEAAGFYDNVIWPTDWDEPKITGKNFDAFLNSDGCYKDNRDMIASVLANFDTYIAQLEEARDVAEKMQKATSGKETSMVSLTTGVTGTKAATGAPAAKLPKTKTGKSDKPASSITGVEEDAKKRNK